MDKQTVIYPYNRKLTRNKKEQSTGIQDNSDEPQKHSPNKKSQTQKTIYCTDDIYMKNP